MQKTDKVVTGFGFGVLIAYAVCFAAWVTNIIWIFKLLTATTQFATGIYVLAVITGFIPPFGIIHGFMIWFAGWTAL